MTNEHYQERPLIDETLCKDWEVIYNPAVQHWYLVGGGGEFRRNRIKTRKGEVDADSLTKKDIVDCFFRINIEAFGPYDILFMRNSKGHIAIFTLIEGDDMGAAYRTDRCGFGYKSVSFYFNTCYKRLTGDVHFIVTETQDGEWGLFAIGHPHEPISLFDENREFLVKRSVAKGCSSEQEALETLNKKYNIDLQKEDRFVRFDVNTYLP